MATEPELKPLWTKAKANYKTTLTDLVTEKTGYIVTRIPGFGDIKLFIFRDIDSYEQRMSICFEYSTGMKVGSGANRKLALSNAIQGCQYYGMSNFRIQIKRMIKKYGVANKETENA